MEPGNLIAGRYRLEQRLAAGGMGEVWRGSDTRLNRVVAVKLLHSGLSGNDRFRARFHQEAQAVAALQSPGIVNLYDYGEENSPEGLVSYLIMELVRGQALDNVLRQRGRLSPNETLKIMAATAEALDVAHRAHIIHRDIKPGNLLVDPEGNVKIVDFGIAAARGQAGLTETGTVMGTLAYASPEQLAGRDLTGSTDVYSLGIVAYECLSGRPPFAGTDPAAIITGHMAGQPAPLPPDVPGPVGQIILRCLAKDPRQRFASAAELARVCRAGGMGGGTTAILSSPPPGQSPQATQVMTPGAGMAAAGMAAGVAAAHTSVQPQFQDDEFGAGAGTGQYRTGANERSLPPPREAEEPKRNPTGPILVTIAGLVVVAIAIWMIGPWGDDDDDPDAGGTTPVETTAEVTEEAAEETSQEQQDDSDDDADEETTKAEETQSSPTVEVLEVPDVTGDLVTDARSELEEIGFENVSTQVQPDQPEDAELCTVVAQTPVGDTNAPYNAGSAIMLYFWDDGSGCGT